MLDDDDDDRDSTSYPAWVQSVNVVASIYWSSQVVAMKRMIIRHTRFDFDSSFL